MGYNYGVDGDSVVPNHHRQVKKDRLVKVRYESGRYFLGLNTSAWTAIAALVSALAVVTAVSIGVASTRAAFRASRAAEKAVHIAGVQSHLMVAELATTYPRLEADVSGEVLQRVPSRGTVMVRPVSGSLAATDIEVWLFWNGAWMRGAWPHTPPNLDPAINQYVGVPVHRVEILNLGALPFADFHFSPGMVGVTWERPDGKWRFGRELAPEDNPVATAHYVMGVVP